MLIDCKGKAVRGSDGHKIGKVVSCDADELVVESGLFKVRDFTVAVDEVASISGSEVFLRRPAEQYRADAPHTDWSPWHSSRSNAQTREELDALARADREHRLGAQADPRLAEQARTSMAAGADRLPSEMDDRLGAVEGVGDDPFTPDEPRGSPPEARMPPMAHPEEDPWP